MGEIRRKIAKTLTLSHSSLYEIHIATGISQGELESIMYAAKDHDEEIVFHIKTEINTFNRQVSRG